MPRTFGKVCGWLRHDFIDAVAFLLVGAVSLWRGWSFTVIGAPGPSVAQPQILEIASSSIPVWIYAVAWIVAGVVAVAAAFVQQLRPYAIAVNFGLYFVWGFSSWGAYFFLDAPTAWVSGLVYWLQGWLVLVLGTRSGHGT